MSIVISLSLVAITSYFPNNLRGNFRKRNGYGVEDAKSRECGIQQQVQVKNWAYGRKT